MIGNGARKNKSVFCGLCDVFAQLAQFGGIMKAKIIEEDVEKLVCDYKSSKYNAAVLSMNWARHLKKLEEYQNIPTTQIIDKAIEDVIGGKVSLKEITEAVEKDNAVLEAIAASKKRKSKKIK